MREQLERERSRADRLEEELRDAWERLLAWWRRLFGNRTGTDGYYAAPLFTGCR